MIPTPLSGALQLLTTRTRGISPSGDVSSLAPIEDTTGLGFYLWLLRNAWWKIGLTIALVTGGATFLAFTLEPTFESTARIAIDLRTPSTVIGDIAASTSGTEADQYFNTELQVIQSDTVLRPVVNQFRLAPEAAGGIVPAGMRAEDAPVSLRNLTVTHPLNSFLINVTYRSFDTVEAAAIANAVAQSYIVGGREMRAHAALDESAFMEKQINVLKQNMDDSVSALAFYEKQLGLINPEEKTSILTARLVQLNTQYTDAQTDRIRKEVAFKAIQSGSAAAIEISPQATALAHMEENLHAAQEKMETVKITYGSNNGEYKRASNELNELTRQLTEAQAEVGKRIQVEYNEAARREQMLHVSLLDAKAQSDALNASSVRYQELKREAEANKNLYAELYRKVKEAGINGAFQSNAVRITDPARPQLHPISPNKPVLIALAFLFSLVLSIVAVLLAELCDKSLRDPEQAQRALGLEVLGILPLVPKVWKLSPLHCFEETSRADLVKTGQEWFGTVNFYEEAARALLSTTLLSKHRRPLRSILITSALQGEGKSCCVAHLAALHAMQGYRTLLIDADLRCPSLHCYFKMEQQLGLADAIREKLTLHQVCHKVPCTPLLDLVTAGRNSAAVCNQVERVVEGFLKVAYQDYDLVFIDAPPMLCFAEPIQLANLADGVLVVCCAGHTSRQAVSGVLNSLRRVGKTLGLVLNQVHPGLSRSYGPYRNYYRHINRVLSRSA